MKIHLVVLAAVILLVCGCTPLASSPTLPATDVARATASLLPTREAPATSTPTLIRQGRTITVSSTADSGPGSLRQALEDAQRGDTITFDTANFPPTAPSTIYLATEMPAVTQGHLTIDASNAGVILDGGSISSATAYGLQLYSPGNTIQGLQIVSFAEGGIVVGGRGQHNTIGGDRKIGAGPIGQANLIADSNVGIGIWDAGASFNIITGNLIGSDTGGEAARCNNIGITISEGAHHNTIGPGNVVAHNRGYGVSVIHPTSLHNTVTQNSIHSNGEADIHLADGGNGELAPPFIFDCRVEAGAIAGSACPNCTIEVFSDDGDAGKAYEGRTTANSAGAFAMDRGIAFKGPNVSATATDADGNTSPFCVRTSETSGATAIQAGNCLPKAQLQPAKSHELADNRLGDGATTFHLAHPEHVWFTAPEEYVDGVDNMGFKWHRTGIDLDWCDKGDPLHPQWAYSRLYVDPRQDAAIDGLRAKGIKVMLMLWYWDEEIQIGEGYSRFQAEDEIERYLDYVRFIVHHFKGRIDYYILGNEPDIGFGTQQHIAVEDYVRLVRQVVPVIRQEDPEAKIAIGGVSPPVFREGREYLFAILGSDVISAVDAISWHTNSPASPEYMAEEYYDYQSLLLEIRDVASANGFGGEYFAEELHWRTPENPGSSEYDRYTQKAAAKYLARGVIRHLGMGFTTGVANDNSTLDLMIQNLATIMAGAEPVEVPLGIESDAPLQTNFSFALPGGDWLIAIWSDGIAADDDAGVPATLTLPGVVAQEVMGMDVLHGFEQRTIANLEDGHLVIPNLLLRDYPIILRVRGPVSR